MRWQLGLAAAMLFAGCQFQWDDLGGDLPLVGAPLSAGQMRKLNTNPASRSSIVTDRLGHSYAVFSQPTGMGSGGAIGSHLALHVARLEPDDGFAYDLTAEEIYLGSKKFYLLNIERDETTMMPKTTHVLVMPVGSAHDGESFLVPNGPSLIVTSDEDVSALYLVQDKMTTEWDVFRTSGIFRRKIPIPAMIDPDDPFNLAKGGLYFFTPDGQWLVIRDGNGDLTLYSSTAADQLTIPGPWLGVMWADDAVGRIFSCGPKGLDTVKYDGTDHRAYDDAACNPDQSQVWVTDDFIYYGSLEANRPVMRKVRRDGTGTAEIIDVGAHRLLDVAVSDAQLSQLIISTDPSTKYVNGAGNGYIGSWKFMERGRRARFSSDASRVFWLEHAALPSGAGDLLTATVPGGDPLRLARNSRSYLELDDGRLVATANIAFRGTQNRVVVIDIGRREQRWIAESATGFSRIPDTNDLLVDVIAGPEVIDVYRVTIPGAQ